jgi:hypothetical protein
MEKICAQEMMLEGEDFLPDESAFSTLVLPRNLQELRNAQSWPPNCKACGGVEREPAAALLFLRLHEHNLDNDLMTGDRAALLISGCLSTR